MYDEGCEEVGGDTMADVEELVGGGSDAAGLLLNVVPFATGMFVP